MIVWVWRVQREKRWLRMENLCLREQMDKSIEKVGEQILQLQHRVERAESFEGFYQEIVEVLESVHDAEEAEEHVTRHNDEGFESDVVDGEDGGGDAE